MQTKKIDQVTGGEVRELIERGARGDKDAVATVVRLFQRQVQQIASIYAQRPLNTLTFNDLVQEGNIGVLRAINNIDVTRMTAYKTYFQKYIRGQILQTINTYDRLIRIPTSMQYRVRELRQKELKVLSMDQEEQERSEFFWSNKGGQGELNRLEDITQFVVSLDCTPCERPYGEFLVNRLEDESAQRSFEDVEGEVFLKQIYDQLEKILSPEEFDLFQVVSKSQIYPWNSSFNVSQVATESSLSEGEVRNMWARVKSKVRQSKKMRDLYKELLVGDIPSPAVRKVRLDIDPDYF